MNERQKPKTTPKVSASQSYERRTYEDKNGIPRVVLLPKDEKNSETGIPVSLDLSPLYQHMPADFQRAFYAALHAQGLIEPADYFKPGADARYQAALRTVLKHDFLNVQTLAKEELNHASR